MRGRFVLSVTYRKLAEHFELSGDLDLSPSWNIALPALAFSLASPGPLPLQPLTLSLTLPLMKLLAIRLGRQKTPAKSLVMHGGGDMLGFGEIPPGLPLSREG
jgi:hypothetical protein